MSTESRELPLHFPKRGRAAGRTFCRGCFAALHLPAVWREPGAAGVDGVGVCVQLDGNATLPAPSLCATRGTEAEGRRDEVITHRAHTHTRGCSSVGHPRVRH